MTGFFSVNRFFIKLFKTSDMHIVTEIELAFGYRPPSDIITDRVKTFCTKYESCDNQLHKLSQLPLYVASYFFVSYCSISTGLY